MLAARLARVTVARPALVLGVCLLATCGAVPLVSKLGLDTDPLALVPRTSRGAQAFGRWARAFQSDQMLIVLVEGDDAAKLREFADRYAAQLAALPEVADVRWRLSSQAGALLREHLTQLLTEEELAALAPRLTPDALERQAHRLRSLLNGPGGSSLTPLLTTDPLELLPTVAARLGAGLEVDARSGYFQSADGHALLVYVRPRAAASDFEADRALLAKAGDAAAALGARVTDGRFTGAGLEVAFAGACAYAVAYRDWLHHDAQASTLLSALAVLLLFGVMFRALRVLPLVAVPLAVGLLWTGAAAMLLFGRVNAVSLTFGTVLLSIGIDFPIQIYNRLREELREGTPRDALERTMRELAAPSVVATLGPAVVFFACGVSSYRGLAELGVLAGVGLVLNLIAMLTVLPALLALLPPKLWARARPAPPSGGVLGAIGRAQARRPRVVLAVAALALAAAVPLALRVRVERRLTALQPPAMPPVRADEEMARRFGARDRMLVALVENPSREQADDAAEAWRAEAERLRRAGVLRGYQSVASLFPSAATQAQRRAALEALHPAEAARAFADALDRAGLDAPQFRPFLDQLEHAPPPLRLDPAAAGDLGFLVRAQVSDEPHLRRIATLLFPADGDRGQARAALETFAAAHGGVITGKPVLEEALYDGLVRDTRRISASAALAVALLLALWYRRARPWLAVMGPLVLAWVGFGAALSLLGLPLNLFNLLAVPLVIGYGIDDHVFLVHRHERGARDPGATLATTGRAIVLTSLSTMAGFAALGAARFDGLRLFGVSGALAVALCMLAAFAVLPSLLALLWPPRG
jgi:predicted exporter